MPHQILFITFLVKNVDIGCNLLTNGLNVYNGIEIG